MVGSAQFNFLLLHHLILSPLFILSYDAFDNGVTFRSLPFSLLPATLRLPSLPGRLCLRSLPRRPSKAWTDAAFSLSLVLRQVPLHIGIERRVRGEPEELNYDQWYEVAGECTSVWLDRSRRNNLFDYLLVVISACTIACVGFPFVPGARSLGRLRRVVSRDTNMQLIVLQMGTEVL